MSPMQHKLTASVREPELRCSFCNKSQADVAKLIAGPTMFICNECVEVCNDILADDAARELEGPTSDEESRTSDVPQGQTTCALCRMPVLLAEALGVPERGFLCAGCVDAVRGALAG